jgi:hypothetical protein
MEAAPRQPELEVVVSMPGVAGLQPARFALGSSAVFRTTPGLPYFLAQCALNCSDRAHFCVYLPLGEEKRSRGAGADGSCKLGAVSGAAGCGAAAGGWGTAAACCFWALVAAALRAAARRMRVFAAFCPAARCFRVATAFLAAARRLRVAAASFPALFRLGLISSSVTTRDAIKSEVACLCKACLVASLVSG